MKPVQEQEDGGVQSEAAALICAKHVNWESNLGRSLRLMSRKVFSVVLLSSALGIAARATAFYPEGKGTIEGTVTGMPGRSVIYVEAVPGETFPAREEHAVVDQRGMLFVPPPFWPCSKGLRWTSSTATT